MPCLFPFMLSMSRASLGGGMTAQAHHEEDRCPALRPCGKSHTDTLCYIEIPACCRCCFSSAKRRVLCSLLNLASLSRHSFQILNCCSCQPTAVIHARFIGLGSGG